MCKFSQEVYCGKETICTVDGLHFNSLYRVRVKAYNSTGEGTYSDIISLQTSDAAWFQLDALSLHPDVILSNDNQTATSISFEHRVICANIGFSRSIHYWEWEINVYLNNADIAFGVARYEVAKDKMLGKYCFYHLHHLPLVLITSFINFAKMNSRCSSAPVRKSKFTLASIKYTRISHRTLEH